MGIDCQIEPGLTVGWLPNADAQRTLKIGPATVAKTSGNVHQLAKSKHLHKGRNGQVPSIALFASLLMPQISSQRGAIGGNEPFRDARFLHVADNAAGLHHLGLLMSCATNEKKARRIGPVH